MPFLLAGAKLVTMQHIYSPQTHSFLILNIDEGLHRHTNSLPQPLGRPCMKLFTRFRKILTRHVSSSSSKPKHSDRFDPPKTYCSFYYSSYSHHNEAISDCIEFFNKSGQDGFLQSRHSNVV